MTMHILPKSGYCDYIYVNSAIQTCCECKKQIDLATETFIQDDNRKFYCEECGEQTDQKIGYIDNIICSFCGRDVTLETAYHINITEDNNSFVVLCTDCIHNEIKIYRSPHTTLAKFKDWRKNFKKYQAGAFKIYHSDIVCPHIEDYTINQSTQPK